MAQVFLSLGWPIYWEIFIYRIKRTFPMCGIILRTKLYKENCYFSPHIISYPHHCQEIYQNCQSEERKTLYFCWQLSSQVLEQLRRYNYFILVYKYMRKIVAGVETCLAQNEFICNLLFSGSWPFLELLFNLKMSALNE